MTLTDDKFCPGGDPPPGWVVDQETGAWMRETVHRMTRRCLNWDYLGTGCYLITLVLNDRSQPLFGRISGEPMVEGGDFSSVKAWLEPSELGRRLEVHFRRISEFTPEIEVVGVQLMPEHLHGVLRVVRRMKKPLGEQLRGFKMGATRIARELGYCAIDGAARGEAARGRGLFADGFVDTILFDSDAERNGVAYMFDNPRRLWVKRQFPNLFKVLGDLCLSIHGPEGAMSGKAHFAAIGNRFLLDLPNLMQVQCSRGEFKYQMDADGNLLKKEPPKVDTPEFEDKSKRLLAAARHGAVLVSPCISHGEKEIAARAYRENLRVIVLQNKGFSPLYKPGGQLFDRCAAGNLLMLAPAAWPYLPGKKRISRMDACALNRLAQLIAGKGAAEIIYHGVQPADIDRLARQAALME